MPNFGRSGAQRTAERVGRDSNLFIKTFKEPQTVIRPLWEDPDRTWHNYATHYIKSLNVSIPCAKREGYPTCLGCDQPADESLSEEERKEDPTWRSKKASPKWVFPALNDKDYLTLYQVGWEHFSAWKALYDGLHTITATDFLVTRSGTSFNDTSYTPMPVGTPGERKMVMRLRQLYAEVQDGLNSTPGEEAHTAALTRWTAGNLEAGIPNIGAIIGRRYVELLEKFGTNETEEAARNQAAAVAQGQSKDAVTHLKAQAMVGGAPSSTERPAPAAAAAPSPIIGSGDPTAYLLGKLHEWSVVVPPGLTVDQLQLLHDTYAPMHAPAPAAAAPAPQKTEEEQLTETLTGWGVQIPPGVTVGILRGLHATYAPMYQQQATPAAAAPEPQTAAWDQQPAQDWTQPPPAGQESTGQPGSMFIGQVPAPGQAFAAPEAAAMAPSPVAAAVAAPPAAEAEPGVQERANVENGGVTPDGTPDFRSWETPDVEDWLKNKGIEFPPRAPRSVKLSLAERAAIGY